MLTAPADCPAPSTATMPRLRIGFILARHFTLTAFANFVDTLRLAADDGDLSRQILCSWHVMSGSGQPVTASAGVQVTPDAGFLDPGNFHYIVVVGGLLHRGDQIDSATASYLRRAADAGTPLIGVCTGAFILRRLGLLKGRKVCVSWYHRNDYIEEFSGAPPIADQLYVVDGDRITCSGGAGVVDLAAALVERHVGARAARKSLNVLLLDESRAADTAQPTPHVAPPAADTRVRRAVLAMEQAMAEPVAITTLARRIGISERQLDRLFRSELGTSPAETYRAMRLDYGYWLLSNGRNVIETAAMSGFADGAHFSKLFRKRFGIPPSGTRQNGQKVLTERPADRRLFEFGAMAEKYRNSDGNLL